MRSPTWVMFCRRSEALEKKNAMSAEQQKEAAKRYLVVPGLPRLLHLLHVLHLLHLLPLSDLFCLSQYKSEHFTLVLKLSLLQSLLQSLNVYVCRFDLLSELVASTSSCVPTPSCSKLLPVVLRLMQYVAAKWEYGDKKGTLKGIMKGWCSCLAESSICCGQGGQGVKRSGMTALIDLPILTYFIYCSCKSGQYIPTL